MKQIKLVFGKSGNVKILAPGSAGAGTAEFTEKLAKELGVVEERHKGTNYEHSEEKAQAKQEQ
jgi:hypothetical protein